jgi:hypothetical protein
MALTDRQARTVLGGLTLAALVAVWSVRIDQFWGDAATYHAMAWSLAYDQDIRYEPKDVVRVRREFPSGPQGVFLKRATGGLTTDGVSGPPFWRRVRPDEERIYFAKPFLYSLVAAPLVRVLGTRGLLVLNVLSLAAALFLGYAACRRARPVAESLALVLAVYAGTVVPIYILWLAPEMFSLGLAAGALALWRLDRPLLAAVLVGVLAYMKPPNIFLAIPLLAAPLVAEGTPILRRLMESVRRGALVAAAALLLFGWNIAFTGEWNFQSGERKTFYSQFPFEMGQIKGLPAKLTFGNSGFWMTTPKLGPQAHGDEEEAAPTPRTEPPRPAAELRISFLYNLGYFWIGRFGGVVPYFLPVAVAALLFVIGAGRSRAGLAGIGVLAVGGALGAALLPDAWYGGGHPMSLVLLACYTAPAVAAALLWSTTGPKQPEGALTLAVLLVTFAFYIWFIPDDWYGNGNLGNRYFVTLVPLALCFTPRRREWVVAAAAAVSAAVLLRPLLVAPMLHSTHSQGLHVARATFRLFPAELTMLNDLTIFGDLWRKKQAYGDTGNAHKVWPAEPSAYWLYFPDDGTFGRESLGGVEGFWLRGGRTAEVILRAGLVSNRVHCVRMAVIGGPAGDEATIEAGGKATLTVAPGEMKHASFEAGAGLPYKETALYVLRFRSTRSGNDALGRGLGSFVRITLDVQRPPRGW